MKIDKPWGINNFAIQVQFLVKSNPWNQSRFYLGGVWWYNMWLTGTYKIEITFLENIISQRFYTEKNVGNYETIHKLNKRSWYDEW